MKSHRPYPCRGCGDDIIFIMLSSGQNHPCQPEPVSSGDLKVGQRMISDDGDNILIKDSTPKGITGFLSHFPLCPEADKFRKKKGEQRDY